MKTVNEIVRSMVKYCDMCSYRVLHLNKINYNMIYTDFKHFFITQNKTYNVHVYICIIHIDVSVEMLLICPFPYNVIYMTT